ncbi:hypothetical protein PACTADRAFT_33944 [Pachysolen tannophilus NRRL Y-2460]|uniref:Alpha N-terminal protein methyltransferase 1 n=1 Tax=Pachysolen tannophilus NRRL Y-2460 TaxID=669874 RepID=A0A1E4TUG1_PACTA|nr:hypothetical protein PACTADRAFT_33944 [Pachysolen tannophilus NRRL Y-2460]
MPVKEIGLGSVTGSGSQVEESDLSIADVDSKISYSDAIDYWTSIPPTVDGVLGGFGEQTSVPKADIVGSNTFIRKLKTRFSVEEGKVKYGIDFGAGVGRVTKDFLVKHCDKVDLLEPVVPFVEKMKTNLSEYIDEGKIGEIYQIPMQDWEPEPKKYYLIWCQWCCGQLPDNDFLKWLDNCKKAIQENGLLVIKENNSTSDTDIFDEVDSSKTRTDENFRKLFKKAGWKLISTDKQKGLPKELLPVRMYALKPEIEN